MCQKPQVIDTVAFAYRKLSAWFLSISKIGDMRVSEANSLTSHAFLMIIGNQKISEMLESMQYFTSTSDLRPSVKDMKVYFRHIKYGF